MSRLRNRKCVTLTNQPACLIGFGILSFVQCSIKPTDKRTDTKVSMLITAGNVFLVHTKELLNSSLTLRFSRDTVFGFCQEVFTLITHLFYRLKSFDSNYQSFLSAMFFNWHFFHAYDRLYQREEKVIMAARLVLLLSRLSIPPPYCHLILSPCCMKAFADEPIILYSCQLL